MQSRRYAQVLAKYVQQFKCTPPSILTDAAALTLMELALKRGKPIVPADLVPPATDKPLRPHVPKSAE